MINFSKRIMFAYTPVYLTGVGTMANPASLGHFSMPYDIVFEMYVLYASLVWYQNLRVSENVNTLMHFEIEETLVPND